MGSIVIITAYSTELYFTLNPSYKNSEDIQKFEEWRKKGLDTRNSIEVLNDLLKAGDNAYLSVVPRHFLLDGSVPEIDSLEKEIFPLSGVSNVKSVLCNEFGKWSIYQSDRYGFNNPNTVYQKADIDFLIIGDSFMHGYCVDQKETLAGNLRELDFNAINLGMGGNGILTRFASLKEYGSVFKPKKVLWFYVENTLHRFQLEYKNKVLKKYLELNDFSQNLINHQPIIDSTLKKYLRRKVKERKESLKSDFNIKLFLKLINTRMFLHYALTVESKGEYLQLGKADQLEKKAFFTLMSRARDLVNSWGGEFYYVYLATPSKLKKRESDHQKILNMAKEINLNIIDTFNFLSKQDKDLIFAYNGRGHFSPEGYRLVAEEVLRQLKSKEFKN